MGKAKKSSVWKYFIKKSHMAICKICQRQVSCSGNTTNLSNHLKRNHKTIEKNMNQLQLQITETTDHQFVEVLEEVEEIPAEASCTKETENVTCNVNPTPSTSTEITEYSSDSSSVTAASKILISNIRKNSSSQPCIDIAMKKIKSFEDGGAKSAKITNALLFMVAKDNMLLNTVEKIGFQYLLEVIAPLYKIPARKQFTELMDDKYKMLSLLMMNKLSAAATITLTCDVWTEVLNTVSFLGITAHFMSEGELTSVSIGVKCFSHTINLIPAKMFEELPDLKLLIDKIKSIVTYFKHSVVAADEFRKSQSTSGTYLKLIQQVSTRWSSTYYMLERFMQVIDHVSAVLINQRNSPPMISAFEVATAQEILKMLKPFETITAEISGEKYPTISKVIPMIYLLRSKINELNPESDVGKHLKKYILQEINARFSNIEHNDHYAIGTILDPRFRKIYFESQLSCCNAIHKINKLLKNMTQNERQNVENQVSVRTEVDPTNLWSTHSSLVAKANDLISENGSETDLHSQLKNYLNQDILPLETNPIQYWISLQNTYLNLSKIALQYLSTIATSVPSERLFSRTGNIMSDNRNRLKGDRLSRLLFLSSLSIVDWHLSD